MRRTRAVSASQTNFLVLVVCLVSAGVADARDQQPRPQDDLTVYDANGKRVGEVVDLTFHPYVTPTSLIVPVVVLEIDNQLVPLGTTKDRFFGRGELAFESPDCVGPPLMRVYTESLTPLLPFVAVTEPGSTVYVTDPQAVPERIVTKSFRNEFFGCLNMEDNMFEEIVVPAEPLADLDTLFSPPFRLGDRNKNKGHR